MKLLAGKDRGSGRRVGGREFMAAILGVCCIVHSAMADPLAPPGDLRLRHDLQLLSDSGLMNIPLTTWPVSWGDVSNAMADESRVHDLAVLASWRRVHQRIEYELSDRLRLSSRLAASGSPEPFRTFTTTPRSTAEAGAAASLMGEYWAVHLEGTAVLRRPQDGRRWRPDGSYAGGLLGNWILTAGWQDRWWGPGWDGSLIMSTNARPIPAVAIARNASEPFDLPVLRWLGPWNFIFFQGVLENSRHVPHALLTGMRMSFRPMPKLEIGLSRTMQWGGKGRPHDLGTFIRAIEGRDNVGFLGATLANQPGNQEAGFDLRWASPLFNLPYAIYAQGIGEDSSKHFPTRYTSLFGLESWGGLSDSGASWRLHMEYVETLAVGSNIAYEHAIYRSGYRYYGRAIGHSIDGDGRAISLGAAVVDAHGGTWEALLRSIRTNEDNANPGPVKIPSEHVLSLEVRTIQQFGDNKLTLGFGANQIKPAGSGAHNTVFHTEAQWEIVF